MVSVGPGARGQVRHGTPALLPRAGSGEARADGRRLLQDGELIPVAVKEGDSVLLPEYGGAKVTLGDEEMYIYRDNELLGVLE